jgi:uncharacterized cupredoxin-like copper-binding protein
MRALRWNSALVAVGAVLAVAGCGEKKETTAGSGGSSGTSASSAPKVSETEFKLAPADLKVDKTGKVEIQVANDGKIPHALEVENKDGEFKTGTIAPGKTASLSATLKPGTYEMYCPIDNHRQQGMEGKLTVGGGGSGGSSDDKGGSGGGDSSGGGGGGY